MADIRPMTYEDVDGVWSIEEESFNVPWTKKDFQNEMAQNKMAVYFVAEEDSRIVGYAGMWHIVNEGHITNVAVSEEFRNRGIGKQLMEALFEECRKREMIGITLEVGVNNLTAQKLYKGLGFEEEGVRKNYYEHNHEDALIMWKYFNY
ncbi:MAG: ribosomal protein S18-alanine N-acetyltransferase [Firmicutes bacterium]|nr:ribosomal protein S18-alanine N-acetyltransferase [Bacillota bacterium]